MTVVEIATVLKDGSPWGIIAILLFVLGFLVKHILKLNEDRSKLEREHNERMLDLIEKHLAIDIKHEQAFNNMAKAFERVMDRL